MKVRNVYNGVSFRSLNVGDVFICGITINSSVYYMKTNMITNVGEPKNAVMLNASNDTTTMFYFFDDEDEVNKVNAELVVK